MDIAINKMVTLSYTLRAGGAEGEVVEKTSDESPLKFVFGQGNMLPMFESNLTGLKQGDDFKMFLEAKDAYGIIDENAIVDIPKDIFIVEGQFDTERFFVGNQVPMQTSSGERMMGVIKEIGDVNLKMDFNHPMAGTDLHFTGNIIEVRDASEEELKPAGCGCTSCGCDDDDSSSCSSDSCGSGSGCGC